FKISRSKLAGTLQLIELPTGVWDLMGLYFVGPVPQSSSAASTGTYVNQQQSIWDDYLPFITFAYNTSKQSTTQIEPFKLMFGRDPMLPFDVPPQSSNYHRVIQQTGRLNYQVQHIHDGHLEQVHVSRIRIII
ncbi:unnamed protein product, partial [Didymodactylos carnosus]